MTSFCLKMLLTVSELVIPFNLRLSLALDDGLLLVQMILAEDYHELVYTTLVLW